MTQLVLKPVVTEKSMMLAANHVYTFEVPMATNKIEVARAVKVTFGVDATDVRMVITKGKIKRFKGQLGRRVDVKKAMVAVKAGQSIKIFDAEPEAKDTKKTTKADKAEVKKTKAVAGEAK